ncbi:hypothetical protein [Streptomyces marianii]
MTVLLVRAGTEARWRGGGDTMTPSPADTPDMSVEEFEELARRAP